MHDPQCDHGRGPGRRRRILAAAVFATVAGMLVGAVPAYADTVRGLSWHLDFLHIAEAQKISQGAGIVVGVVDTGVDATHPDLQGQILPGTGIGADAAPDGRTDPDTKGGHGTAVASLIVAKGGGDMHLLGIAPKAKILTVSTGAEETRDETSQGIRWLADHEAKVINISTGNHGGPDETAAVAYALSKDVVVVASAGNVSHLGPEVAAPANVPGVIAVSGIDKSGQFWSGSARGPAVTVAAPASPVIADGAKGVSSNGYVVGDGTSLAAPMVAGEAALIRAKFPTLDATNVVNRIIVTARDAGPAGRDDEYGFGIIDPVAALTTNVPTVSANPLLRPAPDTSPATGRSAGTDPNAGPAIEITNVNWPRMALCLGVVIVVPTLIVFLAVRSSRRAAARRAAMAPAGAAPGWGPPPGYRPPGYPPPPPGYPPPPGMGPPGQSSGPGTPPPSS
jgi:type VII secretion-associated serine protease mycosin